MSDDLSALEPWLAGYLARLDPRERIKVSRAIAKMLQKRNAERIRQNIQPDGTPMEPRKPKKSKSGRIRARKGKMFKKTALARNMRTRVGPDDVELFFRPLVAGTAAVHHSGLTDKVDHRIRNSIKVRYPARRLFGFSPQDRDDIMATVLDSLDK